MITIHTFDKSFFKLYNYSMSLFVFNLSSAFYMTAKEKGHCDKELFHKAETYGHVYPGALEAPQKGYIMYNKKGQLFDINNKITNSFDLILINIKCTML